MARYIIRFMKQLLGENGRHVDICQSTHEVEAANGSDAAEIAKTQFCKQQRLTEWSLHADRIDIAQSEPPSAGEGRRLG